ncbi:AIR synthase related protein [Xylanimonas allomyrinae]|uniref:AIR synthase related protein n=1 Tax=Xylanimonas allomyrinae TaxID=2509459 RepID=UPI001FE4DD0B|nr:AIR synthase related protein [Xylanimonas allomyrinae]
MPEIAPPDEWSCPLPVPAGERVVLGHGGGGVLSAELIEQVLLPAFGGTPAGGLRDSVLLDVPPELADGGRLAFSTDSYVVAPLFFPGGSIGDLAVHGTINDLAMSGARPLMLSCGLILEEGLEVSTLARVAHAMGQAARAAGVPIGTGDTKVVGQGHADGLYINTAGIGVVPPGVGIGPSRARPGDVVIVSGPIGEHGVAILSQREGLEFGTTLRTDSAPCTGWSRACSRRASTCTCCATPPAAASPRH